VTEVCRDDFELVRTVVRDAAAIVLEEGKEYLVESRLLPVARRLGHAGITELLDGLRADPQSPVRSLVVEAMTTNETSFFRDTRPFDALAQHILPEIMGRPGADRDLTVWSAACSSGQEAYSTAMVLDQALAGRPGWRARIIATDVSTQMLRRTQEGTYSQLEVNRGLPVNMLMQHFGRRGTQWQVSDRLRGMVETRFVNLAGTWPQLPRMDVVLLRNVMIYFDVPTKQRILADVRSVLKPGGYLLLGGAETTLNIDPHFERVALGGAVAYRVREGKATA
jgi:chemotaxis protein methyltransferase CheR